MSINKSQSSEYQMRKNIEEMENEINKIMIERQEEISNYESLIAELNERLKDKEIVE
jgi:septal ring factor EnvC (AmiA/AmiB activator)